MGCLRWLRNNLRKIIIFITPLALLPLLVHHPSKESRCAYGLLLVAIFWVTEALPLPVTSLLPVVIFPLLGVASSKDMCKKYCVDLHFLLIGGLLVAIAIEKSNLHRRFALSLLLLLGVQPRRLLLGFMAATGFLSMWISNTAATAMMIPIARALIIRLDSVQRRLLQHPASALSKFDGKADGDSKHSDVEKASEELSGDPGVITFLSWMVAAMPVSLVSLVVTWFWLQLAILGPRQTCSCEGKGKPHTQELARGIRHDYKKLGKMSYLSDAVPSILVGISLFTFPASRPRIFHNGHGPESKPESQAAILEWQEVSRVFPWGVILLLGGGFAVAEACNVSGLSSMVAQQLMFIQHLPAWAAGLVLIAMTSLATEITSNTVVATLFLPIQAQIVKAGLGVKVLTLATAAVAVNTYCYYYFNLGQFPAWASAAATDQTAAANSTMEAVLNATHAMAAGL